MLKRREGKNNLWEHNILVSRKYFFFFQIIRERNERSYNHEEMEMNSYQMKPLHTWCFPLNVIRQYWKHPD